MGEMQRGIAGQQYVGPFVGIVQRRVNSFKVTPVMPHGECAQPCKLVLIELLARPLDHFPDLAARLTHALATEGVFIVISQQTVSAEIPDEIDALRRIAAIAHNVSQADALRNPLRANIRHHGFQRLQVAMNVTDQRDVGVHRIHP